MRGLYSFKRENIPILPDMFFWFRRQKKKKTKRKLVHFCKNQRFCSFSKRRYWKVCFWLGFANFYVRNHWVVLLCKCKDLRIKDFAVMGFWDAAHDISNINSAHSGVMSIHYKQYVQKEKKCRYSPIKIYHTRALFWYWSRLFHLALMRDGRD